MNLRRRAAAALAISALITIPQTRTARADAPAPDALAIVTDDALARSADALLPMRFTVDGTGVSLDALTICPATGDHDVDLVGLAAPDGTAATPILGTACAAALEDVASTALSASPAPWRAAVRLHVNWANDTIKGAVTDSAIASAPTAATPPDPAHLRSVLTATPLFLLDTRHLLQLAFSGHLFALVLEPKFEEHRAVLRLMRDSHEADDHSAWESLETDASIAVPAGSDAVIAASHVFVSRALAEAFATPVEVYRTQNHVITVHDVREAGVAGDVRASGEAVDTMAGLSGTVTGEYMGATDLTLRRVDVAPHESTCGFVDLGCVANNLGLRVGSGALARQLMTRYGNSPLRPAQPLAFPIDLQGRSLVLTLDAIQTRASAADLRVAGRIGVTPPR